MLTNFPVSGCFQYISRGGKTQRLRFAGAEIMLYYSKAKEKIYLPPIVCSHMPRNRLKTARWPDILSLSILPGGG